ANGTAARRLPEHIKSNFCRRFALGMEVPRQRSRRSLRPRGTVIHCWKCLHKLSSGCHRPLLHKRPVGTAVPGSSWESLARGGVRQDARSRNSINRERIANGSENVLSYGWGNLRRGGGVPPGAIYMDWPVMIGDWSVPMWASWIGLVVAGGPAFFGLRLAERDAR